VPHGIAFRYGSLGVNGAENITALMYLSQGLANETDESKPGRTYAALKNTETTFENVHDWVVQAFPMIDHVVIMDTCDNIGWCIVLSEVFQPLFNLVWLIPATFPALGLLKLCDFAQECDVTGGKEVEPPVNVDNFLPGFGSLSIDQRLEQASLLSDVIHLCGARAGPCPHLRPRLKTSLIRRIILDSLQKICSRSLALLRASIPFQSSECTLHRFDKVVPGAQQHAANKIGCRYAWGTFDNAEASSSFDEAVTIVSITVGSNVVSMDNIFASIVGYPG
jgi:hypothetical protein